MARLLKAQIIFTEKPGYAIITEGVHDLSVDMNTSFLFGEEWNYNFFEISLQKNYNKKVNTG